MEVTKQFFYCNGAELTVSPFDINLKFLRQVMPEDTVPNTDQQIKLVKEAEFTVAMSPAHAKVFLNALFMSVINYEKNIGPISLQSEQQQLFDKTFGPLLNK